MSNTYFKLYSVCVPVMGKTGAIIVDLQKITCTTIPQFLCEILTDYENVDVNTLRTVYDDQEGAIDKYFDHLVQKQLGFYTHEPERYPRMSREWDAPEKIKFAVLQIADFSRFDYRDVLQQFDELMCKNMEVWVTGPYTRKDLEKFLLSAGGSMLRSITMVMPYNHDMTVADYEELVSGYGKLGQIYLHKAPKRIKLPESRVFGIRKDLGNFQKSFPHIPRDEYLIFMDFLLESMKYNPYYNGKICIDSDGFIKNCLTHSRHFGNISERRLGQVADDPLFRELWYVTNDRILDIKDSEYRYIWLNTHDLEKVDDQYYRMIG